MAATATRWNLLVDAGTDAEVREFLAEEGLGARSVEVRGRCCESDREQEKKV